MGQEREREREAADDYDPEEDHVHDDEAKYLSLRKAVQRGKEREREYCVMRAVNDLQRSLFSLPSLSCPVMHQIDPENEDESVRRRAPHLLSF